MVLWEPEQIKTLLPSMAVMVLLTVGLNLLLGKKDLKIRMIPFQVIAVLLLILEVGKQAVSFSRGYNLYHIPLHFCSLFLLFLPLMAFYRGKHQGKLFAATTSMCVAMFLLMAVYPALIYSGQNVLLFFKDYFSFHTVAFHNLVMFATMLIFGLKLYQPIEQKKEMGFISVCMVVFSVLAATFSQVLKTNYANFYQCNVPPLENIRLTLQDVLGYGLSQTIYVAILLVLHILFLLLCYWIYRGIRRLTARVQPQSVR